MERFFVLFIFVMVLNSESVARRSVIMFSSELGDKIQVLVEGKLINKKPKSIVKINSLAGPKEFQVNVYDEAGFLQNEHCEVLHIKSDFKSHYMLSCNEEGYLDFRRIKEKRQYSVLDNRPELLYHRRRISSIVKKGIHLQPLQAILEEKSRFERS